MNVRTARDKPPVQGETKMPTFTIDEDNNITVSNSAQDAAQAGDSTATRFDSQAALRKVSAAWPLSRHLAHGLRETPFAFTGQRKADAISVIQLQFLQTFGEGAYQQATQKPAKEVPNPSHKNCLVDRATGECVQ